MHLVTTTGTTVLKTIGIIVISVALLILLMLLVLSYLSQSGMPPGLKQGRLAPCPGNPNCVCSEFAESVDHYIEPIPIAADDVDGLASRVRGAISEMGGEIRIDDQDYLAATFKSRIFRFVDDVEIRLDRAQGQIHIRSASRAGRSDLGANRARMEQLRQRLTEAAAS